MEVNNTGAVHGTGLSNGGVGTVDIVVIIIYLALCMLTGLWATWRTQRGSVSGYFLAGRDILWFAVGASLFSSNIGSGSFVGLAGTGAASGIAVASYELNGLFCLLLLGWIFVPVYIASGVYTMPEYLMRRFGGQRLQVYMAILSLIIYVFTKISADIYAGAIFIQQSLKWDMYVAIAVLLAITAVYTVSGGLKAVIYTDTLQTVIMVGGAIVLMGISFAKVGGMDVLYEKYFESIPDSTCGLPNDDAFHLMQPADSNDLPWPGNVFDEVGCVDPDVCESVCENRAGCTNIAYPKLVIELMPTGLKGLMLAAMMAALMSSLTSVFNSSATIFTIDLWKRVRPKATEAEMLVVGRVFVMILIGVSIVWVPVLQASQGGQLFNYIQSVTGYFAPPILSTFLMAVLWERTNEKGAFWGLMLGLVIGLIRMGLDFGYGSPACGEEDTRPVIISRIHFLHFTIILFVITLLATFIISIMTKPIDKKHLIRLTWWTRHSSLDREEFPEEKVRHDQVKAAIEEVKAKNIVTGVHEISKCRRVVYLICGYEPPRDIDISEEEAREQQKLLTSVREDKKWKWFVNCNAILLIVFGAFLWGFYS